MKNIVTTLSIMLFYTSFVNSQVGWYQQYSGTSAVLRDVYFLDVNSGFICGYNGIILKTTNSGTNWSSIYFGSNQYPNSIYFANQSTGFLISAFGSSPIKIIKTTDGGSSWDSSGTPKAFCMFFLNPSTGWTGGTRLDGDGVYRTTDNGISWAKVSNPPTSYIYSINFINYNTGFIAGQYEQPINPENSYYSSRIYKTVNSGVTWSNVYSGPLVYSGGNSVYKIQFANEYVGYALGRQGDPEQAYLYKTTNSGNNWTLISILSNMNFLDFVNELTGWIGGYQGTVLYTTDGGLSWNQQASGTSQNLLEIHMVNNYTGWIVGTSGTILATTNGGVTYIYPINSKMPISFNLYQNYPNPFNPSTKIKFSLPKGSYAKLFVYDILGREVAKLVNEQLKPGSYEVEWDGSNNPSGVYFYRLTTEDASSPLSFTKKMILVK